MPTALDVSPSEPAIDGTCSDPEMPSAPVSPVVARRRPCHNEAPGGPNGALPDPELPPSLPVNWYVWCKPVIEYLIAVVLFVLASPVMLLAALLYETYLARPGAFTPRRAWARAAGRSRFTRSAP